MSAWKTTLFTGLALVSGTLLAAEFHVDTRSPHADDANPGTREQPWKTFAPARERHFQPGDRILIHSGTYWDKLDLENLEGTPEAPIIIEGVMDGGPVIIKGSERFKGDWRRILDGPEDLVEPYPDAFRRRWVVDCPGPRVNQVVLSDQRFLQQIGPNRYSLDTSVSYVRLPPVGETVEDMFRWTFFHDVENEKLYIDVVGSPSWYLIDVSRGGAVLRLVNARHVVVRNLDVRYGGNGPTVMKSDHVRLENVTSFGNSVDGFAVRLSRNVTLYRCRAVHNGRTGIGLAATYDCDVIETEILENNYRSFHTGWHAGGTKNVKTVCTSFVNCIVARNNGDGIWFDIDCQETRIAGNRIHDNRGNGVHYEISFGESIVANNLIYRNVHSGVYLSCSAGTLVAHNTLVGNGRGISVAGGGRRFVVPRPPAIDVSDGGRIWREAGGRDGLYPMSDNRVLNNLLIRNGTTGDRSPDAPELLIQDHPVSTDNVSDFNVFVGGWWPVRLGRNWNDRRTLDDWRQVTDWDTHSVVVDDLAYTINANGVFSWDDPADAGRVLRVCPPLEEVGEDLHGRQRTGDRVHAGAEALADGG